MREYRDGLLLFLNRTVQNLSVAEELTEETFVRLVIKRPRFSAGSSFKTWLYAVGRNLALNYLRRERRIDLLPEEECAELESIEQAYLREERKRQLHRAMEALRTDYAQVLFLKYFEELTNEQIAQVMKKRKRQVENLLYQAKITLRTALAKEGFTNEDL